MPPPHDLELFVRVGYFIPLNGPLTGHPSSVYYAHSLQRKTPTHQFELPTKSARCDHLEVSIPIGVRDGGGGQGGQLAPQFGQFVDIHSGRESTLFGGREIRV